MRRAFLVLPLLFAATPAWAEISDKMASSATLWIWAICFNLAAWALARKGALCGLFILPIALFWSWVGLADNVYDPLFAPAVFAELGQSYVNTLWATAALSVAGPALIVLFYLHRQRRQS